MVSILVRGRRGRERGEEDAPFLSLLLFVVYCYIKGVCVHVSLCVCVCVCVGLSRLRPNLLPARKGSTKHDWGGGYGCDLPCWQTTNHHLGVRRCQGYHGNRVTLASWGPWLGKGLPALSETLSTRLRSETVEVFEITPDFEWLCLTDHDFFHFCSYQTFSNSIQTSTFQKTTCGFVFIALSFYQTESLIQRETLWF